MVKSISVNDSGSFQRKNLRSALVIAHPGHELMVHGWLEVAQPRVFVLTDGSGRSQRSRLSSTAEILKRAGAQPGSIYGKLTDSEAYAALLNREFERFLEFVDILGDELVSEQIDLVAGDALEGYNPMHDVCRLVINAAVTIARRNANHRIANLEFSLIRPPQKHSEPIPPGEIGLKLEPAALERKLKAARGYAELTGEVFDALRKNPVSAFELEHLRAEGEARLDGRPPFYEQYGEQQVAAGHYQRVLRYREHVEPLAEALSSYAGKAMQAIS